MRRTILGLTAGVHRGSQSKPRRHGLRPALEGLEGRALLSHAPAVNIAALPASRNGYAQTNLVSDQAEVAQLQDPNLVNPWGIAFSPTSPFWVADNGSGAASIYMDIGGKITPAPFFVRILRQQGGIQSSSAHLPTPDLTGWTITATAPPTGIVFNSTSDFLVSALPPPPGAGSFVAPPPAPAVFLFATTAGTIAAWTPKINQLFAIPEVDNSASGAVYTGLALASNQGANNLYAANFHSRTIDVFDSSFHQVSLPGHPFRDSSLPKTYAPFGIENIGNLLYVTYAKQNSGRTADMPGFGVGAVDVFRPDGTLLKRLIRHGQLDSPWGLTIAPPGFGAFGGDLLVGNFGNGRINAYDPTTGHYRGQLTDPSGRPDVIPGLWGLTFGNGQKAGDPNVLYCASGPSGGHHGLFGSLTAVGRHQ